MIHFSFPNQKFLSLNLSKIKNAAYFRIAYPPFDEYVGEFLKFVFNCLRKQRLLTTQITKDYLPLVIFQFGKLSDLLLVE